MVQTQTIFSIFFISDLHIRDKCVSLSYVVTSDMILAFLVIVKQSNFHFRCQCASFSTVNHETSDKLRRILCFLPVDACLSHNTGLSYMDLPYACLLF